MRARRVALVVDNPDRDLPGLALAARYLAQAGVTCFLVPMNLASRELWDLVPDFALLNYARQENQSLVNQLADCGIGVGVLDTEGGVFGDLSMYEGVASASPEVRARVSCLFTWGPRLAEWIVEHGLYSADQVTVTGNPRFDLYKPPWREALRRGIHGEGRFPRPLILINCSFPLANPRFKSPEEELRAGIDRGLHPAGLLEEWQGLQQQALSGMTALTARLAARFPQATVVLRPHPFERALTYRELLTEAPNLHVVQEGTVHGWILRSAVVVQCACSTAIEASMANLPALNAAWITTSFPTAAAIDVSVSCPSPEEMVTRIEEALAGKLELPDATQRSIDQVESDWFHNLNGLAHERIGRAILANLAQQPDGWRADLTRARACRRAAYGITSDRPLHERATRVLRSRLRAPLLEPPPETQKVAEKRFYPEDVRAWVELFAVAQPGADLTVESAAEAGAYRFGYRGGRSVAVRPSRSVRPG